MSADTWDRDQRVIADKRAELLIVRLAELKHEYRDTPAGEDMADLLDWFLNESRTEATATAGITS